MSTVKEETIATEIVEKWPDYLNENILKTLKETFKFEKMTPVQVYLKFSIKNLKLILIFI